MVEWSLVIVFHDVFVFLSSLTYCLGFPIYSSSWIMRDNTHCVPIEVQFKETENKSKLGMAKIPIGTGIFGDFFHSGRV